MFREQITIPVTVDCAPGQAEKVKQFLSQVLFKSEGLIKLDEKITKKDFLVISATKDFITKK